MAGKNMFLNKTRVVEEGGKTYVEEIQPGGYEKLLRKFENSKITKLAGTPMQVVENKVNRAVTFKIAFVSHFKAMTKNDALIRRAVENGKNILVENY